MTWRPQLTLKLADLDATEVAVGAATVSRGRETPFEQPRAGYARLQLLDPPIVPSLLDRVQLLAEVDSVQVPLWSGEVSDVEVEVIGYGQHGDTFVANVTAVGPLARVHRGMVRDGGYPQQLDGERVAEVLLDAVAARYATVSGTRRFVDTSPDRRYSDSDLVDLDQVDAGLWTVQADLAGDDPWRIVQQAANDGGGAVYETRDGLIGYADADRRLADAADGYLQLPDAAVLPLGLRSAVAFGEVANTVELTYSTGTVVGINDEGVRRFGAILTERVSTRLLDEAAAQQRAELIAAFRSSDARRLDRVVLDLASADLDEQVRAELLTIDPGRPVRLIALPAAIAPSTWSGFVEAVELTADRFGVQLALTVSPFELSALGGRWASMPEALTWQGADPTVTWNTAEELLT